MKFRKKEGIYILSIILILIFNLKYISDNQLGFEKNNNTLYEENELYISPINFTDIIIKTLKKEEEKFNQCIQNEEYLLEAFLNSNLDICDLLKDDEKKECIDYTNFKSAIKNQKQNLCEEINETFLRIICKITINKNNKICGKLSNTKEFINFSTESKDFFCQQIVRGYSFKNKSNYMSLDTRLESSKIKNIKSINALLSLIYQIKNENLSLDCNSILEPHGALCQTLKLNDKSYYLETITRKNCYEGLIINSIPEYKIINSSICKENISEKKEIDCLNQIILSRAIILKDVEYCNEIKDKNKKTKCQNDFDLFMKIIIQNISDKLDYSLCEDFMNQEYKDLCINTTFKKIDNELLLSALNFPDNKNICRNITNNEIFQACNSIINSNITECEKINSENIKAWCLIHFGELFDNITICDSLKNESAYNLCNSFFSS
jgi:hypothetical protein